MSCVYIFEKEGEKGGCGAGAGDGVWEAEWDLGEMRIFGYGVATVSMLTTIPSPMCVQPIPRLRSGTIFFVSCYGIGRNPWWI